MYSNLKIVYIHKAHFDKRPPIIAVVERLIHLNTQLTLVTSGITDNSREILESKDVKVIDIGNVPPKKFFKFFYFLKYRNEVWRLINTSRADIVWIGSGDAALVLGKKLLKIAFILQLQELYDTERLFFNRLKQYARHARLNVVPLKERAMLLRHFYVLENLPMVMHNKPFNKYFKLDHAETEASNYIKEVAATRKIILYQGGIDHVRNSHRLMKLSDELTDEYVMVMMGPITERASVLLDDYPKVIHIDRIDAPSHLQITKLAHIGIIDYTAKELNSVFCAPNKMFEYSKFGVPIIANNLISIPELRFLKIGASFDYNVKGSFIDTIRFIECDYDSFSKNSLDYFSSIDGEKEVMSILERFFRRPN